MKTGQNYQRKKYKSRHGLLYTRLTGVDLSKCVYCGAGRQALDHVPPISVVDDIDVGEYVKSGGKFRLFPACSECNKNLSKYESPDYYDRLQYLSRRYEKKLSKMESWSQYEIDQLGPSLQSLIKASQSKIDKYQVLLSGVEKNILAVELGELEI